MYTLKNHVQISKQALLMLNYCQLLPPVHIVPSAPSSVRGLCTAVVWDEPSHTNGQLIGYDLRFYSNGYENIVGNPHKTFRIVKETDVPSHQVVSTFIQVSVC